MEINDNEKDLNNKKNLNYDEKNFENNENNNKVLKFFKENIIGIILIFIGARILLYVRLLRRLASVKVAFSNQTAAIGCGFILYGIFRNKIKKLAKEYKWIKITKRCIAGVLALITLILGISAGFMISYKKFDTSKSDYVIVLGAGLIRGREPNAILGFRLQAAKEYVDKYAPDAKIIVSGGQSEEEKISEAQAMKEYLLNLGVNENKILMEDNSTITKENLEFSKKIIEEDSGKSTDDLKIKIVTSDFHAFRSHFLAEKAGLKNVSNYSNHTNSIDRPMAYFRESFAIVKSWLFD